MRGSRSAAFEKAVLALLLATTGCGGSIVVTDDVSAPAASNGVDAGVWTPPNANPACGWYNATWPLDCEWDVDFTLDAMTCVGFAGAGTAAQCAAICGSGPLGQAAETCTAARQIVMVDGGWVSTLSCLALPANGGACH